VVGAIRGVGKTTDDRRRSGGVGVRGQVRGSCGDRSTV
jgi:hypothetical protein